MPTEELTMEEAVRLRDAMLAELTARRPVTERFERYYDGDHDMPAVHEKVRVQQQRKGRWTEFLKLLRLSRANWCMLVVDAVVQRLTVTGFRFGDPEEAEPTDRVNAAWQVWQENRLDAVAKLVHRDSLVTGYGYVVVWPTQTLACGVRVTAEHPSQCIVRFDPETGEAFAGLKVWTDGDVERSTLYHGTHVWKWQRSLSDVQAADRDTWARRQPDGEEWPLPNPLGVCPMHEFKPRPNTRGVGKSELADVIDIQDRINVTLFHRVMSAWYTAVRQRYATGLSIETDPETGEAKEPFETAIDALWYSTDPQTRFGEFSAIDLKPFIDACNDDVQAMASISQTPPDLMVAGTVQPPSGDALKAIQASHIAKVEDRAAFLGEEWEAVQRTAALARGDAAGAADQTAEIEWRDPAYRTEGELVDALVKMRTLGVPLEVLWKRWGATPREIVAWKRMLAEESMRRPDPPQMAPTQQIDSSFTVEPDPAAANASAS